MENAMYLYFSRWPRTIKDLKKLHAPEEELPFTIVKTIVLSAIDYENFRTDLTVDRGFMEENAALCRKGAPCPDCLLIKRAKCADGILVVPEQGRFVGMATYFPG